MKKCIFFFAILFWLAQASSAEDIYKPKVYDIHCWQSGDQIVILFKYYQLIGGMDNCAVVIKASVKRKGEIIEFIIEPAAVKNGGYKMKGLDSGGVRATILPIDQEVFRIDDEITFEVYLINKLLNEKSNKESATLIIKNLQ